MCWFVIIHLTTPLHNIFITIHNHYNILLNFVNVSCTFITQFSLSNFCILNLWTIFSLILDSYSVVFHKIRFTLCKKMGNYWQLTVFMLKFHKHLKWRFLSQIAVHFSQNILISHIKINVNSDFIVYNYCLFNKIKAITFLKKGSFICHLWVIIKQKFF